MRGLIALLFANALTGLQDSSTTSIEKTAKFPDLVRTLGKAFACNIAVDDGVEPKEVALSVHDAGFFQALDALCKAHGNVNYFDSESERTGKEQHDFRLFPGIWTEYPSAYSGPFKVIATALNRFQVRGIDGEQTSTCVHLVLLGPPGCRVDWGSGSQSHWSLEAAKDGAGANVLWKGFQPPQQVTVGRSQFLEGNVAYTSETLRDFDLDRGLSLLKGKVTLTTADSKEVRLPLDPGAEVEIPGGKLKFEGVTEHDENSSRIAISYLPLKGNGDVSKVLEHRVCFGSRGWEYLRLSSEHLGTFEIEAFHMGIKPTWVKLRVRSGERKVDVPFELKDVRFKKG